MLLRALMPRAPTILFLPMRAHAAFAVAHFVHTITRIGVTHCRSSFALRVARRRGNAYHRYVTLFAAFPARTFAVLSRRDARRARPSRCAPLYTCSFLYHHFALPTFSPFRAFSSNRLTVPYYSSPVRRFRFSQTRALHTYIFTAPSPAHFLMRRAPRRHNVHPFLTARRAIHFCGWTLAFVWFISSRCLLRGFASGMTNKNKTYTYSIIFYSTPAFSFSI